ncbi:MAG: PilZ domain-containing protein [Acidobacteriota bacterium]|nr:PilZ domain-containing protein [Acidobacteriota bacterium]
MPPSDKRRFQRHPVDLSIWLRHLSGDDDYQHAEILNLGMGGALCMVQGTFRVNQQLDLAFQFPNRPAMVGIKARVAHVIRERGVTRLGIEFVDGDGMALTTLMSYIEGMVQ